MQHVRVPHPGPTTPGILVWPGRLWMWLFGWQIEGEVPPVSKGVVIAAPHTSNWDFVYMLGTAAVLGVRLNWLGKHTMFRWPMGPFFLLGKLLAVPAWVVQPLWWALLLTVACAGGLLGQESEATVGAAD